MSYAKLDYSLVKDLTVADIQQLPYAQLNTC